MLNTRLRLLARSLSVRARSQRRKSGPRRFRRLSPTGVERLEDRTVLSTISGTIYDDINGNGVPDVDGSGNPTEPASSGVMVFLDTNGNGLLDAGEAAMQTGTDGSYAFGIAWDGASLWILNRGDQVIQEFNPGDLSIALSSIPVPDADLYGLTYDGSFLWANGRLSAPTYQIDPATGAAIRSFETPYRNIQWATGIAWDGQELWIAQWKDFDILRVDVRVPGNHSVTVDGDSDVTGVDFGRFQLGTASGHAFEDLDGSGAQETGEPNLEGWSIYIDSNQNGSLDPWEQATQTDANGNFTLTNIPAGDSPVGVELKIMGWAATTPGGAVQTATLTASGGNVALPSFGVQLQSVGPVGGEFRVNETVTGLQQASWRGSVAELDAEGNSVIVWSDVGDGTLDPVMMRLYDAEGNARTGEIRVSTTDSVLQDAAKAAMAPDGRFAVTWRSGTEWSTDGTTMIRLVNADGTFRSGEIEIAKSNKHVTVPWGIDMDASGNFAVLYAQHDKETGGPFGGPDYSPTYFVQRFDAAGVSQGDAIFVGDSNYVNLNSADLAMDEDGNFAVVVSVGGNTRIFSYDAAGQPIANGTKIADGYSPLVAMNSSGEHVISWTLTQTAARQAQVFNAQGEPITGAFQLSRRPGQSPGRIAMSDDGLIVYTRESVVPTGVTSPNGKDVLLEAVQRDGAGVARVAGEAVVNSTRAGDQFYPTLGMNRQGDFIVVWSGVGADDVDGVFAQRFAAPPPAPNAVPVAEANGPYSGAEDAAITFDASGSTDPDGDALSYTWDFGDGQSITTTSPTVSHTYAWGGSFDVTLTVDDGRGGSASDTATASVTEVNDAPVADPDGPYSGVEGEAITFDASASFDFDNHDGSSANDQTLTYTWDFGDGTTATGMQATHTYAVAGDYTVTLTVSDGVDISTATTMASVTTAPTGNANDMYVWDIVPEIRTRGKGGSLTDARLFVTVLRDSDAGGDAESGDAPEPRSR